MGELRRRFDERMALKRLSRRTARAYRFWIRRFLAAHPGTPPDTLGEPEVKGQKDRHALLPASRLPDIKAQMAQVSSQHALDPKIGAGWVELPFAFARKSPHAGRSLP